MSKLTVSESIQINASPERVFEVVSDFATWTTWSPWLCMEPDATVEISDNPNSIDSGYSWQGEIVGQGSMHHKDLVPAKRIEDELTLLKPWKSKSKITFDLEPVAEETKITWTLDGTWPWFLFWMKSTMVSVIGMDYERGLKMLKEYIETGKVLSKTNFKGETSVGPMHMVGVRKKCQMDNLDEAMSEAISETVKKVAETDVPHEGIKISVYHHVDLDAKTFEFTAGMMVHDPKARVPGLVTWSLPESKALAVEHTGSYANLGNAWGTAYKQLEHKKLKLNDEAGTFEIYRNEPTDTAPADLITDIFLPLK